jgi:CubicO group peptidase (beta-lactamase class C family)
MKAKAYLFSLVLITAAFCTVPGNGAGLQLTRPEDVGISSLRLARIDNLLQGMVDGKTSKGAVAAVARHGKLVYLKAFGEQDDGKPMREDTIFRICSQTKLVTSVAVMMLYEEGLFTLNEPIAKYIPEFKDTPVLIADSLAMKGYRLVPPKRGITIRDLLAHTSGISYAFWGRPFIAEWYLKAGVSDGLSETPGSIADNIRKLAQCPLLFHPGDAYEYGLNTDVLGYFVEVVSGMTLAQFFQERILNPLGMQDTHFFLPEAKISRLAAVYESDGRGGLRKLVSKVTGPGLANPEVKSNVFDPFYPYRGSRTCFSGAVSVPLLQITCNSARCSSTRET